MENKFKLFKQLAPAALLIGTINFAFADYNETFHTKSCENDSRTFKIFYDDLTFKSQSNDQFVFFREIELVGQSYARGTWDIVGKGKVTDKVIDVKMTLAFTGSSDQTVLGQLKGEKVKGEWKFSFIPSKTKRVELLNNCRNEY